MGARGRKSKNDLETASVTDISARRHRAPPCLTKDEQKLWTSIMAENDPNHFQASQLPLLEDYVRLQTEARRVAQWLAKVKVDETGIADYDRLLRMQEKISRTMASLSVRLGFGKITKTSSGSEETAPKPWE